MKKYRNNFLFLVSIIALTSCSIGAASIGTIGFRAAVVGIGASSYGFFSRPDVNLKEKNYAAADFIAVKIQNYIDKNDIILAKPLEEIDNAGISSPLGYYIPEGIGLRFIELGYKVQLHEVATNGNANLYPAPKNNTAKFVLKGTYKYGKNHMDIFLRIIDLKSAQVIASFDYTLPLSKEVRDLSKTEVKIFRTSK